MLPRDDQHRGANRCDVLRAGHGIVHRGIDQIVRRVARDHRGEKFALAPVVGDEPGERVFKPLAPESVDAVCTQQFAIVIEGRIVQRRRPVAQAIGISIQDCAGNSVRRGRGEAQDCARVLRHADERDMCDREMAAERFDVCEVMGKCRSPGG